MKKIPGYRSPVIPRDRSFHAEPCPRWLRAVAAGEVVVDTRRALVLHVDEHLPVYAIPVADLDQSLLVEGTKTTEHSVLGKGRVWDLRVGEEITADAVARYDDIETLADHAIVHWDAMDAWFEEDEEVFVHPRDPYKRVDVLPSSRQVQVMHGGAVVADSGRPVAVFETGLPVRYYLPREHVRTDLLVPSGKKTRCPYKGQASYFSLRIGDKLHKDFVWTYTEPTDNCRKLTRLLCFFDEWVDQVTVDGGVREVETPWSR